jgi:hypothetical protein
MEEWEGKGAEVRKSPHTIIRQEPKKPEMQNTGDETQKEEEEGTKSRMQTKRKVWWLGRLASEGRPGSRKDAPN